MVLVAVAAGGAARATVGERHLRLIKSSPAKDAELGNPPGEIRLWFSEETELSVSRIKLTAADGTEIELGRVEVGDENTLVAAVAAEFSAGSYEVAWRTSSRDGHPITGAFGFSVVDTE